MTRVAALQMNCQQADIDHNLEHAHQLIQHALTDGAEVIALPEFFTTSIVLDDRLWDCALNPDNQALDLLRSTAQKHQVLIGGSYLELRNGDIYNCYALVRPDGTVTRHDKDLPTMIENAFYVGGNTDGVHQTDFGRVGTAVCWETIRTQTVTRLKARVDFLMTGSHWWTVAENWKVPRSYSQRLDASNRSIMVATPGRLAGLLGVANIHAAHCGTINGKLPLLPWRLLEVNFRSSLIGETQIVDNHGKIIARRTQGEGAGCIMADIELTPAVPQENQPSSYWIPKLPLSLRLSWWQQNAVSRSIYRQAKQKKYF